MAGRRASPVRSATLTLLLVTALAPAAAARDTAPEEVEVSGDAIPRPLTASPGNADRGRLVIMDRESGNCLICHRVPEPSERFQGELGPGLNGVGTRLTEGQLRLRLVDQSRLNPATLMPPYYRVEGLARVAEKYRGRPVLTAQQIEDVVAYLRSLSD